MEIPAQKFNSDKGKKSGKISKSTFEYYQDLLTKKITFEESIPYRASYLYPSQNIKPDLKSRIIQILQKSAKPSIKTTGDSTFFCINYNFDTLDAESSKLIRIEHLNIDNTYFTVADGKLVRSKSILGHSYSSVKTVKRTNKKTNGIIMTGESEYLIKDAISQKIKSGKAKLVLQTIDYYDSIRIQRPKVNQQIKICNYMFVVKAIANNQLILTSDSNPEFPNSANYSCFDSTGQVIKLEDSYPRDPDSLFYKKEIMHISQSCYDFISKHPEGSYEDYLNSHPTPSTEKKYYYILNGFCPETKSYLICIPHYNKSLAIDLTFKR
jgi:hypothetical protein